MQITRRRMLTTAGIASVSAIGGCLGESSDPGAGNGNRNDDNDTDDGNETGTGNDSNDTEDGSNDTENGNGDDADSGNGDDDTENDSSDDSQSTEVGDEVTDYETVRYEANDGETTAVPFSSREEAESHLDLESRQDDERSAITDLLESTDFEADSLVALETQGSNGCSELQLKSLEVTTEDGISMAAAAVDTSSDDEMCTQEITNLGLLVRVSYDGEAPSSGKATITDGQGGQRGVGWSSGSDSTESEASDSAGKDE
ncbi:hypothetical protein ACFQO4_13195 [Saliphagus sp. GCM10025334]